MNEGKNFNEYKGIIPPLVTPLKDTNTLDQEGLEKLVEHILQAQVSGLFILGTTGEGPHMSIAIREELIKQVAKIVNGRTKILVGVADTSITESVKLAQVAADAGAGSVVATPPYYFGTSQPELTYYFQSLAEKLPLPLFLYNMPVHTKTVIEPGTVKAVAESSDNVIGLKDSSANMNYIRTVQYLMKDQDFPIFCGPEEITADAVMLGGAGGVNGGANMFPKLYTAQYEAAVNKDFEKLEILRNKVLEISQAIYSVGAYGSSSYLQGLKGALSVLGLCDDYLPEPFQRLNPEQKKVIEERLEKLEMKAFSQQYLN